MKPYPLVTSGDVSSSFHLDPHSGQLKTSGPLNDTTYKLVVEATTGNSTISGTVEIHVKDAGGGGTMHGLSFDRTVYFIQQPTKEDIGRNLQTIRLSVPENSSPVNVSLNDVGRKVYKLVPVGDTWHLYLKKSMYLDWTCTMANILQNCCHIEL